MEADPKGFRLFLMEWIEKPGNGWNLGERIVWHCDDPNIRASTWVTCADAETFSRMHWNEPVQYLHSREITFFDGVIDVVYEMKALEIPRDENCDHVRSKYFRKKAAQIVMKEKLYAERWIGSDK